MLIKYDFVWIFRAKKHSKLFLATPEIVGELGKRIAKYRIGYVTEITDEDFVKYLTEINWPHDGAEATGADGFTQLVSFTSENYANAKNPIGTEMMNNLTKLPSKIGFSRSRSFFYTSDDPLFFTFFGKKKYEKRIFEIIM